MEAKIQFNYFFEFLSTILNQFSSLWIFSLSYTKAATISRRPQDICLKKKIKSFNSHRHFSCVELPGKKYIVESTIRDDYSILLVTNLYIQCQPSCKTFSSTWSLLFFPRCEEGIQLLWNTLKVWLFVQKFEKI